MEKEDLGKILNMVKEGTMTPDEAVRLIDAFESKGAEESTPSAEGSAERLRIRITDLSTGRTKANLSLPLWLVRGALKLGGKNLNFSWFGTGGGKDLTERLQELASSGQSGTLLDVVDEDENEKVEIFVE